MVLELLLVSNTRRFIDNLFQEFDSTAKFWTEMYATNKNNKKKDDAIARVCEMGFDKESAEKALVKHNWDESAAVNELLGAF